MCEHDGWVCFRNGELMSGVIDKAIIGGGAKESLFAVILRDYSAEASALCMSRLAKLTARFLAGTRLLSIFSHNHGPHSIRPRITCPSLSPPHATPSSDDGFSIGIHDVQATGRVTVFAVETFTLYHCSVTVKFDCSLHVLCNYTVNASTFCDVHSNPGRPPLRSISRGRSSSV